MDGMQFHLSFSQSIITSFFIAMVFLFERKNEKFVSYLFLDKLFCTRSKNFISSLSINS